MADVQEILKSLPPEKRQKLEQQIKENPQKFNLFPLSYAQERLWFLDQLYPNSSMYNISTAVKIRGKLNIELLEKSLNQLIQRHEILRTRFVTIDGIPYQAISKQFTITIPVINIQDIPEEEKAAKIKTLVNEEANRPFNLGRLPLLRATLIQVADSEYILVFTMHHIISDGWSFGVVIGELIETYQALQENRKPRLPELPIQFVDFALWQRKRQKTEAYQKQLEYWKHQLGDIPPVLELPADFPRPHSKIKRGSHLHFEIPKSIYEKIKQVSQRENVTPFMILAGAFNLLLSRLTRQDDIAIGVPVANRDRSETRFLIGFLINTVVLRNKIDLTVSVREFLSRVKKTTLEAFANQEVEFEKLVEILHPERNTVHSPLFQVLLTYQNMPKQQVVNQELTFERVDIETDTVKFDLTLTIDETPDKLFASFGYNVDLFKKETIELWKHYFLNLLANALENLDAPLHRIPLENPDVLEKLYQKINTAHKHDLPQPALLHRLFEQQVMKHPGATAILAIPNSLQEDTIKAISYRLLNEQANQVAHALVQQGVAPESVVGLYVMRSPEMIAGMLGILKAGAAYLPLDPAYPTARILEMLNETESPVVLTQRHLQEGLSGFNGTVLILEDLIGNPELPVTNPMVEMGAENLAYIIFTSGSTGKPKGVLVPHRSVVNYVTAAPRIFHLTPEDRVLQFASISFDAAAEEIYPTLLSGATLVLRPDTMISSAQIFVEMSQKWKISVWDLPTAYWHQLIAQLETDSVKLPDRLKLVIIGGERAKPEMLKRWQQIAGNNIRLLNTYGPTETTIVATYWEAQGEPLFKEVPIGKPVPNATIRVMDAFGNVLPPTIPGELCIGGVSVTRGYLKSPDLTALKFVPDDNGNRLYRTGDVVRLLLDNNLEYLGRIDHQVKVRGYRIELGEIETVLRQHPEVQDVLVTTREDKSGQNYLVAYYIPRNGEVSATTLREYLKGHLPDYMVPSIFMPIDAFPLTPSGKINVRLLPAPGISRETIGKAYVAPETPLEQLLVQLWEDVLGMEKIGVEDNFFEIGGDSLKAAILINKLQKELEEVIYVVALFDAQTVRELAHHLEKEFPEAVERWVRSHFPDSDYSVQREKEGTQPVNISTETLHQFQVLVEKRYPVENEEQFLANIQKKNKPAVFILSAPRSGSTLLRVMLAGNPALFSPPELALLNFRTLKERKAAYADRDAGWLEGLYRAIMEIKQCDFEEAKRILSEYEDKNYTTYQFYGVLQEWLNGKLLVDKTTTYALSPTILKRAEHYFENPMYIHLVRNPNAMVQSYIHSHLDQVFGYDLPFSVREKAEMFWITANKNIQEFLGAIPEERRFFVQYEELVTRPESVMRELSAFLGIEFHPEMLEPYRGNKMTDGVHPESKMVGDPLFHKHKKIDPDLAKKWQSLPEGDRLHAITVSMAKELGYSVTESGSKEPPLQPVDRSRPLPLSFAQQRLWFLHQLNPDQPTYNMPFVYKIRGKLNVPALQKTIQTITERHEILRTHFIVEEGKPYQVVNDRVQVPFQHISIRSLAKDQKEDEIQRLVREYSQKPFDFSQAPLFRVLLLEVDQQEWVLVLVMHHIISDGWSMGVFVREVGQLYSAFANNQAPVLEPLPLQYGDYAVWQRAWMESPAFAKHLEFWKDYLAGMPPLLELPTDRPRPATQTYRGDILTFSIPAEVSNRFKEITKKNGATLFSGLLSILGILLRKYSGQDDFGIGIPVANRNRPELEQLIGFFVNTLALRVRVVDEQPFQQWVKELQGSVTRALAHQEVPFEKVVDAIDLPRDTSYSPLFQVMFSLNNIPRQRQQVSDITVESMLIHSGTAKFDLSLEMIEQQDGSIAGLFEYNVDLFDRSTIERLSRHFQNLMAHVVENPSRPLVDLTLLDEVERDIVLHQWNQTENALRPPLTFPELFEQQVEATPDAGAAVFKEKSLTYRELNEHANQLARLLVEKGVGPDQLVGIAIDRSVEMVLAIVAVLKSGGAYVPLDPSYPRERLQYILQDAGIQWVLTTQNLEALFTDFPIEKIYVDQPQAYQAFSNENLRKYPHPDNLAYIIYTSGSTGKPKGVMISHRSMVHLKEALVDRIYRNFTGKKFRATLNAPILFDASVQQLVLLLLGHELHIVPQEARMDGASLMRFLESNQIDVVDCVPTQLKLLMEAGLCQEGKWKPSVVLPGGEAIDAHLWQQLQQCREIHFFNMYGPTECTVDSVVANISEADDKPVIGRPLSNMRAYILDNHLNPVPIGVVGEIYLSGLGVARGYLNRPELTAERFLPDPFNPHPGSRMYRTGDLGRFRPNGEIEYVGRADFQVKVQGYRIELGEIEATLNHHPAVKESVVVVHREKDGHSRIVAYWVATEKSKNVSASDLKTYLAQFLPGYMIPAIFMRLEAFPLTPNGKIDRRRLPKPQVDRSELESQYVPPSDPIQEKLVAIWQEVLKIPRVGIRDNFFELGGDSILSIQVVARANQAGLKISPLQIFQYQTIEQLAAVAEETTPIIAEQGVVTGEVPVTPIQLWFFEQKFKKKQHWNQSVLFTITRPLDKELLRETVRLLMHHHDMLRARFTRRSSGVLQQFIVEPDDYVPFHYVDLSTKNDDEFSAYLLRDTLNLKQHLNLKNGPLLQVAYFQGGPERHDRLFLTVHHLVMDGVSWRILVEDFFTIYQQLEAGREVQLPPKTTAFKQWAEKLKEFARSEALKAELDYWQALPPVDPTVIPLDNPEGSNVERLTAREPIAFSEEETETILKQLPEHLRATINEVLLSALAMALIRWTGKRLFHITMEGHGREHLFDDVDISRTLGWFTSMYPVVLDMGTAATPEEIVKQVKNQVRAVPRNGIGFGLLKYLGTQSIKDQLKHLGTAPISFNYLGQFDQALSPEVPIQPAMENTGPDRAPENHRPHLLDITGGVRGGKMEFMISYSRDVFHPETVQALAHSFQEAVREIIEFVQKPEKNVLTSSDFPLADLDDDKLSNLLNKLKK